MTLSSSPRSLACALSSFCSQFCSFPSRHTILCWHRGHEPLLAFFLLTGLEMRLASPLLHIQTLAFLQTCHEIHFSRHRRHISKEGTLILHPHPPLNLLSLLHDTTTIRFIVEKRCWKANANYFLLLSPTLSAILLLLSTKYICTYSLVYSFTVIT